ncbi:MAG: hypothetical protein PWP68_998 [Rikenellaceae bacterium]|nr:hypothetical protein [Rikenellaceae bacterium]
MSQSKHKKVFVHVIGSIVYYIISDIYRTFKEAILEKGATEKDTEYRLLITKRLVIGY